MGKSLILLVISIFTLLSCKQSPEFQEGVSEVLISSNSNTSTLSGCFCWVDDKMMNIKIGEVGFEGSTITITHELSNLNASMEYWSDTNQFDGKNTKSILINEKSIAITYSYRKGKTYVKGDLDIDAEDMNGESIKATGTFSCNAPPTGRRLSAAILRPKYRKRTSQEWLVFLDKL